jgi:hypothetical protein
MHVQTLDGIQLRRFHPNGVDVTQGGEFGGRFDRFGGLINDRGAIGRLRLCNGVRRADRDGQSER